MWKDIRQVCFKLLLLVVPFFVLLPLYCKFFPDNYLDEEYAMYRQQSDLVLGKLNIEKEPSVLVLGDSRTKAAFLPAELSEGTYNLALGGTTPIEGYYTLKNYLKHHEKPQKVVMAYAPMHFTDVDTLWTRCIYFHTMSYTDFKDLMTRAGEYEKIENIRIEDYQLQYLMHALYLPNKYATALKKSAFVLRRRKTKEKYASMVEFKGQSFYGLDDYSDGVNGEAKVSDFLVSDIITAYARDIIQLCRDEGIELIWEQTPMNETSYGILSPEFKTHFREYMAQMSQENPDICIYPDFYCYPNECFGDADHLNPSGVKVFDTQMKEKYSW